MNWRHSSQKWPRPESRITYPSSVTTPQGKSTTCWSATLHRIETDRWGLVVVMLAVDITNQVRARHLLEERERRHLALQQTIAAVPGENLVSSLQHVADALVPALQADVGTLRLLDADAKLHLVAASGLRPAEIRRLALDPITARQLETMIEAGRRQPSDRSASTGSRCAGSGPKTSGLGSCRSVRAASGVRPKTTSRCSTPQQRSSATPWRRSSGARSSFEAVLSRWPA